jgi:TusA-related sulfurtransferase
MAMVSTKPTTACRVIDARTTICPKDLFEAPKGIQSIAIGEILEIWCNDPGAKMRMVTRCTNAGYKLIGFLPGDGYERFFIRRMK